MDKPKGNANNNSGGGGSRGPAVAGLIIAIVLLVVGLWLARELDGRPASCRIA